MPGASSGTGHSSASLSPACCRPCWSLGWAGLGTAGAQEHSRHISTLNYQGKGSTPGTWGHWLVLEQGAKHSKENTKIESKFRMHQTTAALAGASTALSLPRLMSHHWAGPGELTAEKHLASVKNQSHLASVFSSAQEIRHMLQGMPPNPRTQHRKISATCLGLGPLLPRGLSCWEPQTPRVPRAEGTRQEKGP